MLRDSFGSVRRILLLVGVGSIACIASAQVFPADPSNSGRIVPGANPASPPPPRIIKGYDPEGEQASPGRPVEPEEDDSMVWRRLEYQQARHRIQPDESKLGHAQLRLQGIESMRHHKPVPRTLSQLMPLQNVQVSPLVGPPAEASSLAIAPAGQVFGTRWVELGPSVVYNGQPVEGALCKVAGRVSCAALDPSDATRQTIYLGAADGGVWKTTNHGATWAPLTDFQPSLSIGCITVNPGAPNEVYVGTGEAVLSGDSLNGAGILVSTDSGATWVNRQSVTLGNTKIGRIALDRATTVGATRHMVAATMAGLYATNDAFQTISLAATGSFSDVIQDLSNQQTWWATRIGNNVSSLYKSINNGTSWTQQNTGIPTNLPYGLATIVQAPSNSNVMYAAFNNDPDSFRQLNIYKSTNGGSSWSQIDNNHKASEGSGQFFYNLYLAVNPVNANEIYVGGAAPLFRSTNGGSTFTDVAKGRSLHADHHFGFFRPDGSRFYDGNDGGLFYTDSPGSADWVSMNTGLGLLQVNEYGISLHPTRFEILAGTQDNGVCRYQGSSTWNLVHGGDGGFILWDPTDSNYVYHGYIYDSIYRSLSAGYDWTVITPNSLFFPPTSYSYPFYAKAAMNPANPNMVVIGGDSLIRNSVARTAISWTDATGKLDTTHTISAIAFAPSDGNVCYLGFDDGKIFRTGNIAATLPSWSLIMTHPNGSWCADIGVDPGDPNHVTAVFYRFTDNQVYEITNAAGIPTVINRSSGFPAIAPNTLAIDATNPSVWYVGTEVGVYRTQTGGTSWENFSTGLPNVAVDDLALDNARSLLVAGTHGRGVWMVGRPDIKLMGMTVNDSGIGGNGNGCVDKNERIRLTFSLANFGNEDASSVTARLDNVSANASLPVNNAVFPTLVQGGAAQSNATAFEIVTGSSVIPGQLMKFVLTISSNSGNFAATIPIQLRGGVANPLVDFTEGFESGFGGFTQTSLSGAAWSWQVDTSKPASGTKCAHFEEPYPAEYQLDQLKSPVTSIPATANRITVSFDQTNACQQYGYSGGKVFLSRDGASQLEITTSTVGVLDIQNGYSGKFDSTYPDPAYRGTAGYVNGGPGLPYATTSLELDPAVWAGHTLQVVFSFNYNSFDEKRNGPTGWFIDNYHVKAERYTIQNLNAASNWQLLD